MIKNLFAKLKNTMVNNKTSKYILGEIIKKELSDKNNPQAEELLLLAWKWQVPQIDEIIKNF